MKKQLVDLFFVVLGSFVLALGVALFIIPNDILTGGLAGVSLIINAFIDVDTGTIIFILSISLLMLGTIFMGKKFFVNTCVSSVVYPLFLILLEDHITAPHIDPVLATIYGGLLVGAGVGLVVRQGSSTGGMDIPPIIINRMTGIDVYKSVMVIDALTVSFGFYTYGFEKVLVGLISVYVSSLTINKIVTFGGISAKSVQIISKQYKEINDVILKVIDRGTTIMDVQGGYTGSEQKMILVVVSSSQYNKLIDIVHKYDKEAFVIVQDATDVKGEGFNEIVRI